MNLPDEVLDRAMKEAEISLSPERPDVRHLRGIVEAVADLLVEHGWREAFAEAQEREATNAGSLIERGRQQERASIKSLLEARAREAVDDYRRDPQAYHRGREDELLVLADELDSAGAREDGK